MRKVDFNFTAPQGDYSVFIGETPEQFSGALLSAVQGRKALVLSDFGAADAAIDCIRKMLDNGGVEYCVHMIDGGEQAKSLYSLDSVLRALTQAGFTRSDIIINLGGGVIGDLGGFAAAVFMRGIDYINIPTTLLSMIDSAMGGKTGIDLFGYKNLIGAFHQPKLVLCASSLLVSLPERELRSGFGEVLKYYCLSGSKSIAEALASRRADPELIEECCLIKCCHVSDDVHDRGKRRLLNLGHTFGHAFEAASGFELSHGEAVAMGLIAVTRFGEELGITEAGVYEKTRALAAGLGISVDYAEYSAAAADHLSHDKKADQNGIEMAFIRSFGQPFLQRVPLEQAADFLIRSSI